ncbi:ribosome-inactivating family protein [Streptomyces flaveus]|uniref:Ribosome inactivating protein n=1 Tax=Streptomyces flaveus TaxID=66370 RepID=A0A917QY76_9ACTN|nr:ribosome-inactivating family protein [Streptomyces flaveus]GGK77859.1 hypothetical protein GCM10010094_43850 [Streptomyces flaveus]
MSPMSPEAKAVVDRAGGRGHKRRSRWLTGKFLVLFLAIATLLGGGALVAPQFQDDASAIDDGRDIVWDINGGPKAYQDMIKAVRQRATNGAVLREGVLQTDPTLDPKDHRNIFAVELRHSGVAESSGAPRIRLLMRARDLFVIGWHLTTSASGEGGDIVYFKGDDPGYLGADPRTAAARVQSLDFTGSYTDLERFSRRNRAGLTLSPQVMEQAFRNLRTSVERLPRTEATADAAMLFIMTIAETARFDPLEQAYRAPFDGGSHTISTAEAELMNSWGNASTQLVNNLNDRTPIDLRIQDPNPDEVDFIANTAGSMAAILAIALLQSKS